MGRQLELKWQTKLIKGVVLEGGYGSKWASEWQAGKPDVIIGHRILDGAVFMEMKYVDAPSGQIDRVSPARAKQVHELTLMQRAGMQTVLGVVVSWKLNHKELFLYQHDTGRIVATKDGGIRWQDQCFPVRKMSTELQSLKAWPL